MEVGLHLLGRAAKIDGLADEIALQAGVRVSKPELVGLSARKSGRAVRVGEAKALVDLRIDPHLGATPQPHAGI